MSVTWSFKLSLIGHCLLVLVGPPAVTGSYKIGSVRLSVHPSVLPSFRLSGRFWVLHGARNSYEVVSCKFGFSRKIFFCPKNWGNWLKIGFFENLVIIFYLIWKHILFAVFLHKSHIWKDFCSWNMDQNVLSQSDCRIL